jgi:hypothetical protein
MQSACNALSCGLPRCCSEEGSQAHLASAAMRSPATRDRGRSRGLTLPLPPNQTGDFLAYGSPVSGSLHERWPLVLGLRLRRLTQVRRSRHSASVDHLPPVIPLSRVANMRSVHTAASVHSHVGGTSLPCLANGTPGSLICSCISFTLPPSCPPSLHGRYPLHRYYEDSDSCPAPFCTRTGILGSRAYASGHSISTH